MGWTRQSGRVARDRRRPSLEALETRQLLSVSNAQPAGGPNVNADGSTNFDKIIGASAARAQYHVDGTGQTVAVIDTGVNYNHEALGGAIGPGNKVVAGVDFTGSTNGVIPTWQHGTGVASLIGSSDSSHLGVAPGADIVALRVFGDDNSGSFSRIADALDWVVQHHGDYNISAVNLSISDGGNYTSNAFANDGGVGQRITSDVAKLDKLNIPVVVAAGNSFDGKSQGIGFPSIVPDTISVTATDTSDQLVSNAQRLGTGKGASSAVKLAAPGVGITGAAGGNSFTTEDGTSFAAPQVTGSILLLQQMYENAFHTLPTVSELNQLLQAGAVQVHDNATGIDVGRLSILNSATLLSQQINNLNNPAPANPGDGGSVPGPTNPTPSPTPPTPPAPAPTPLTQVIVNGVTLGNFSTAQLAAKYPGLFAFLKGPVSTLRIWAKQTSSLNLGPSYPSSSSPAPHKVVKHPGHASAHTLHATTVGKPIPVAHKTVVSQFHSPI